MLRLDYFSCLLTVLSTVFVARRQWFGLIIGAVNCVVISVIGYQTRQYGFIAANVFCMATYLVSVRSWRRQAPASAATPSVATATPAPGKLYLVSRTEPLATGTDPRPSRG